MKQLRVALFVSALLAAGAFYPAHNYNYFVLLKWVVFTTSIWAAVIEGENKQTFAVVVFCVVAVIHNPIMRFYFDRNIWLGIDGVTAAWMIFKSITIRFQNHKQ
jgi:hypothetical protein